MPPRSPLAPCDVPALPPVAGVTLATAEAGIRYANRTDTLLVRMPQGTSVAGVFTRSCAASAAVEWCKIAVKQGRARALVANSGNSNAFTGKAGVASVRAVVEEIAKQLECPHEEIFVASTGVIGEPLPPEKILAVLPGLLAAPSNDWERATRAIMTTDTFMKMSTRTANINGVEVRINAMAKGSGMIAPDMATMLGFIFTDAAISPLLLQEIVTEANEKTFNCISVDSDTSTSDTVLLFATGAAAHPPAATLAELEDFKRALQEVMLELAHLIVKDGEGASKFVSIHVSGAESQTAAKRIGLSIANSPLVKTAIAGEDANWGRIVMAVGKAGQKADRDALSITIGGVEVAQHGMVVAGYDETPVVEHMKGQEISITVDVGVGKGEATVWTCDLTHGYIDINGSYRS